MKSIKIQLEIVLFLLAAGWFVGASGCSDKSTNPSPPEDKDYVVYLCDGYPGTNYYAYHTKTGVVDTITLPYIGPKTGLAVSPDGSKLYLNPAGMIVELEAESLTVIGEHPLPFSVDFVDTRIAVSPNGRYLVSSKYSLAIIDLTNYSVVFRDTTRAYYDFHVSPDSRYVFCSAVDTVEITNFLTIDLENDFTIEQRLFTYGHVNDIESGWDNTLLYMVININYNISLFRIYDRINDSILFDTELSPGFCRIQLTNDEQHIFLTQPGHSLIGIPGLTEIKKFDAHEPFQYESIPVDILPDDSQSMLSFKPKFLRIAPDGNHLIGTSYLDVEFFDFDIHKNKFLRRIQLLHTVPLMNPVCQANQ